MLFDETILGGRTIDSILPYCGDYITIETNNYYDIEIRSYHDGTQKCIVEYTDRDSVNACLVMEIMKLKNKIDQLKAEIIHMEIMNELDERYRKS
jgi:hypothetical protein